MSNIKLDFNNGNTYPNITGKFSDDDQVIYCVHNWYDDGDDYFDEEAENKYIPRNAYGIRLRFDRKTYWKVNEDGYIYQHAVTEEWDYKGEHYTTHYIQPETDADFLAEKMKSPFVHPNQYGEITAEMFVYIDGKRISMGNGTEEYNKPRIERIVKIWQEKGYKLFKEGEGLVYPPRYLDEKEEMEYLYW